MSSVSKKQLLVISAIMVLMAFLLSLDIKGLIKPKGDRQVSAPKKTSSLIILEDVVVKAKESLPANRLSEIENIEKKLTEGRSVEDKEVNYKALSSMWDSAGNQLISALYLIKIADETSILKYRIVGAEKLKQAAKMNKDSVFSSELFNMALQNYKQAYEADSKNLDAKIGLAVCYVEKSENPMQGISLLLDVVKEHPDNKAANMNLGLFSMRSGQFDKAVNRFKTVAKNEPGAEVFFYLGEAYRNLGDKENAISSYKSARKYITEPQLKAGIDNYINELTKVKN